MCLGIFAQFDIIFLLVCAASCRDDQFTCQSGQCISRLGRCDGQRNCGDGSDEFNCPSRKEVKCGCVRRDSMRWFACAFVFVHVCVSVFVC